MCLDHKSDALRIYKDYIVPDSQHSIELPLHLQEQLEEILNSTSEPLNATNCFNEAQKLVVNTLKNR